MTSADITPSVSAVLRRRAETVPDALLLRQGACTVTYGAAERITARLGARIAEAVPAGELVAICFSTGPDAARVLLAANRVGVVATFLDRAQPVEQVASVVAASGARLVIALDDPAWAVGVAEPSGAAVMVLDGDDLSDPGDRPVPTTDRLHDAHDLAGPGIVVYSSGSTGTPKGTVRGLDQLLIGGMSIFERNGLHGPVVFGEVGSMRFVTAATTVYVALQAGASVSFPPGDPFADLRAWIVGDGIEVLRMQVAPARTIADLGPDLRDSSLRLIALAGEPCFATDISRLRALCPPSLTIELVYGASESGAVARRQIPAGEGIPDGPIRFPRPDDVVLIDDDGHSVPDGEVGELLKLRVQRTRGYWRQPDLTSDRYLPRPDGGLDFLSGDLGRIHPDGTLEIVGRRDSQVKVRGHNVDLSEVEAALVSHPAVDVCVVVAGPRRGGGNAVLAFYRPVAGALPGSGELRRHLMATVAPAKVPSRFIAVDRFPSTSGGKIDRRALARVSQVARATDPVAPSTPTEHEILGRWIELLGDPALGVEDDFFENGGDSLSAIELAVWLSDRFGVEVRSAGIVMCPTVAQQAALVSAGSDTTGPAPHRRTARAVVGRLVGPAQNTGTSGPVVLLVAGGGDSIVSQLPLARAMREAAVVYGAHAPGIDDRSVPHRRVGAFATAIVDELIRCEPTGPYVVVGHSFGGIVAHDVARRLEQHGSSVRLLAVLDTRPPDRSWRRVARWAVRGMRELSVRRGVGSGSAGREGVGVTRDDLRRRKGIVFDEHVIAAAHHLPRRCAAPILVVRAIEQPGSSAARFHGWARLTTGVVHHVEVRGTHVTIRDLPFVAEVAAALDAALVATLAGRA